MTKIKKYSITLLNLGDGIDEHGGFDLKTNTFKPFDEVHDCPLDMCDMLDAITAATEAGSIDYEKFVTQLFATPGDFQSFIEQLAEYRYRLHDRWWSALAAICSVHSEPGFVTNEEVSEVLQQTAVETGQI